jgi:hypothetical protein
LGRGALTVGHLLEDLTEPLARERLLLLLELGDHRQPQIIKISALHMIAFMTKCAK